MEKARGERTPSGSHRDLCEQIDQNLARAFPIGPDEQNLPPEFQKALKEICQIPGGE